MPIIEKTQAGNVQRVKSAAKTPFQDARFNQDDKSRMAVTVGVTPEKAYSFFRNFQNLPLFMKDLKSVTLLPDNKSQWTVEVKGFKAEWVAEITAEIPGQMISWQSTEKSEVETSGTIWFSPAPRNLGTVIELVLHYKIPGGKLTELLTKISGEDPKSLAFINLRRLKCFLETDELATNEGQSSGRDEDSETITKH